MDDQRKAVISGSLAVGLAISMLLVQLASAQSGCTTAIISLSPCLGYIAGNTSTPSSSCCSQLATVVQSEPACLCSVLNGGASSLGVTVNQTRALALPGACGLRGPNSTGERVQQITDGAGDSLHDTIASGDRRRRWIEGNSGDDDKCCFQLQDHWFSDRFGPLPLRLQSPSLNPESVISSWITATSFISLRL
ncbi:non-specific lipid transfer protein GPI-anchored 2-like isoform X2 [Zingiber officinale]|uniref:Bifunctional inhibitor/plant lipid transfer protein/seed storage helical domain-containing protein n=1 Tax=Zingiber officinale TaxID=94328 RepID=A0A8J5L296_ZINOF|nr:non-specific lipid transfer protein GPI-anchored 2-like isoform X2 [Zingiber officinale]KAG6498671.1 hypothetical protein ZIOFF_038393 [Zingiber officinale]